MTTKSDSGEIDLLELIVRFTNLVSKNLILIVVFLVIGLGTSLWVYYTSQKVYESKMIVYSDILTESSTKLADNIKELIRDGNLNVVGEKLNLSPEEAMHLKDIEIEKALENIAASPEEQQRLFMEVTVEVTDNSILPKLQEGIINFIQNNDFVKVRVEQRKKNYRELIDKIKGEIQKLEAVKEKIGSGTFNPQGGTLFLEPSNPFSETVELYTKQLEYEEKLELVNSVQLVQGFVPHNRPSKPKLSIALGLGIFSGILLAAGIIFLRFVQKLAQKSS